MSSERNWLNWPESLPVGDYSWSVKSVGIPLELARGSFRVTEDARSFVVPPDGELLRRASNRSRPRLLPKGDELSRLKAALYGPRLQAWERLLARVRKGIAIPPAFEPQRLPNRVTEYVEWARELNRTANAARSEAKMVQEATWAWMITRDPVIGKEAMRRAVSLAAWDSAGVSSYSSNDQMTRDIAIALAQARDGLHELLSETDRKWLISATEARIADILVNINGLTRRMDRNPRDSHGYGGLFVAAAASALLAGDSRTADQLFLQSVPWIMNAISPWGGEEGGFSNGTAYSVWSLEYLVPARDILKQTTDIDISNKAWSRGFADFLLYFVPPGAPANVFGDGWEQPPVRHLAKRYSRRSETTSARWYEGQVTAEDDSYLWLLNAVPTKSTDVVHLPAGTPNGIVLPDIGWAAMHSSLAVRGRTSVYFKSGRQGSFNHSHADHNSFVIHSGGQVLTGGSGYYDPYAYYGTNHWKNWYQQTRAHNAITFDGGQGQITQRLEAAGEITHFGHSEKIDYVSGDATAAYGGALSTARRTLVYLRDDQVIVYDTLSSDRPRQWEWNIHAYEPIKLDSGGGIQLRRGNDSVCVTKLAGPPVDFSQLDEFSAPPDMDGYAKQWHGSFVTRQKARSIEFVFLLSIGCRDGAPRVSYDEQAKGWNVRVDSHDFVVHRSGAVAIKNHASK